MIRCPVLSFITSYTHYGVSAIQNLQLQTEKKNAKLILSLTCSPFVNRNPKFTWSNIDCFLSWYLHGSFSNFYSNIYNIKLIIDMYNWKAKGISCIQFDSIQVLNLLVHTEHDNVLTHVSMLSNLVFDKTWMHGQ